MGTCGPGLSGAHNISEEDVKTENVQTLELIIFLNYLYHSRVYKVLGLTFREIEIHVTIS